MLITEPDDLTQKISNNTRKFFGAFSLIISVGAFILSLLSQDEILVCMSLVAGIPLFLISLSMLFGKGKEGKEVFSAFTLYAIGTVVGVSSVVLVLKYNDVYWIGFVIAFGCYALAKKRQK